MRGRAPTTLSDVTGEMLERLLRHRGLTLDDPPTVPGMRRLAPVLGLHAADLVVIADLELPADLAPAAPTKASWLVEAATRGTPEYRHRLHELVRAMPPADPAWPPEFPPVPGALLIRLLLNRAIGPHSAKMLLWGMGVQAVSGSTVYLLGQGRTKLTPRFVTAFAGILGIPAADLAAMTGVAAADRTPVTHPHQAEVAALAWDARRLGEERIDEVLRMAEAG